MVDATRDAPLTAHDASIPAEHALRGFDGVRAFSTDPERSRGLLEEVLGFAPVGETAWEVRGAERGGLFAYDPAPASGPGVPGAGTVHHVAWSSTMDDHDAWQQRVAAAGSRPTPVIDRFWFRSVYFREPSGVLFEIATLGPGFAVDEEPDHLGESLILPPAFEHLPRAGRAGPDADHEPAGASRVTGLDRSGAPGGRRPRGRPRPPPRSRGRRARPVPAARRSSTPSAGCSG